MPARAHVPGKGGNAGSIPLAIDDYCPATGKRLITLDSSFDLSFDSSFPPPTHWVLGIPSPPRGYWVLGIGYGLVIGKWKG